MKINVTSEPIVFGIKISESEIEYVVDDDDCIKIACGKFYYECGDIWYIPSFEHDIMYYSSGKVEIFTASNKTSFPITGSEITIEDGLLVKIEF